MLSCRLEFIFVHISIYNWLKLAETEAGGAVVVVVVVEGRAVISSKKGRPAATASAILARVLLGPFNQAMITL